MSKQIFLPAEAKKEMERTFKVNKVSLWNALTFNSDSSKAKMLRAAAIQRGGVLYDPRKAAPGYMPDCVTTFETADKTMTQVFNDRVHLIADLATGTVTVYADGEVVLQREKVDLTQLSDIQIHAHVGGLYQKITFGGYKR